MTAQEIFQAIVDSRQIDLDSFIDPDYDDLADPLLLPDVKPALKRIEGAIKKNEKVAIFGDYDVDGLTATVLLDTVFKEAGLEVETYIPDRFKDGYGLSEAGIDELASKQVSLIITVDTGSLGFDQIEYAKSKNIDVIVTDHHTVGDKLPAAIAVINPKRQDSKYPFANLAGVGVAFTLARAMQTTSFGLSQGQEKWLLDLVALGTVCDIVPLVGENRLLVHWGLKVLENTRREGLKSLLEIAHGSDKPDSETLGYRLGPRLNASGRIDHAKVSLDLLMSSNPAESQDLAAKLNLQNYQRQQLQQQMTKLAADLASQDDSKVLVLTDESFNHGVAGVVASKIVEKFKKPVFILERMGDISKGSARSFGDFDLAKAIAESKDLIITGGGHKFAAGVTIKTSNLLKFSDALNKQYKRLKLQQQSVYFDNVADVKINSFSGLNQELLNLIDKLKPFGQANQPPLFEIEGVSLIDWKAVGSEQTHAKASLKDDSGRVLNAIGFSQAKSMPPKGKVKLFGYFKSNSFNGSTSLQIQFIDIKTA